jgi:hypothetical protein
MIAYCTKYKGCRQNIKNMKFKKNVFFKPLDVNLGVCILYIKLKSIFRRSKKKRMKQPSEK